MSNISNQQSSIPNSPPYSTPFNVDFFLKSKSEGYFREHILKVLSLPEPIKNILINLSTAEFIEENLGQSFRLSADQKTELTRIIRDTLLADVFLGDFPSLISSKLGIDMNTANQVAQKIMTELFAPAIEDIKNMQREKFKDRIAQAKKNQTQQPPPNTEQGNVINLRNREN